MRKGDPKPNPKSLQERIQERRNSIAAKCHPAIFELAQLWGESIEAFKNLGPNPPRELIAKIETRVDERLKEIHRQYSGPVPPAPKTFAAQTILSKPAMESESDARGVIEWLHWERHKVPLKQDVQKAQGGDWNASRRVQRTVSDLEQIRCGKSPIRPFKCNLEHWNMFETLWGFGLERLTPEELAIFFGDFCPCGAETHEPDAMEKQRGRFKKALEES